LALLSTHLASSTGNKYWQQSSQLKAAIYDDSPVIPSAIWIWIA